MARRLTISEASRRDVLIVRMAAILGVRLKDKAAAAGAYVGMSVPMLPCENIIRAMSEIQIAAERVELADLLRREGRDIEQVVAEILGGMRAAAIANGWR